MAQRVRWQWCPLPLPLAFSPFLPISLILIQLRDIKIHARIQFTFTLEKILLSRSRSLLITVIIIVIIIICHRYSYRPTPALIQLNCILGFYTYALWKTIVLPCLFYFVVETFGLDPSLCICSFLGTKFQVFFLVSILLEYPLLYIHFLSHFFFVCY